MKNKFFIVAASTAVLGSTLVSAPAHAQISPGPNQNISVDVTVPEILFLRTITTATLAIAPTDFTSATLTQVGTTNAYTGSDKTIGSTLDTSSPFTVGSTLAKSIPLAYAVWSNTPRSAGINVTVSAGSFQNGTATLPVTVNASSNVTGQAAPGLNTPYTDSIDLDITPGVTTSAGTYTGTVNVQVDAP